MEVKSQGHILGLIGDNISVVGSCLASLAKKLLLGKTWSRQKVAGRGTAQSFIVSICLLGQNFRKTNVFHCP